MGGVTRVLELGAPGGQDRGRGRDVSRSVRGSCKGCVLETYTVRETDPREGRLRVWWVRELR